MANALSKKITPMLFDKIDEVLGVLSLCEIPDSLLMWAHYGVSHTGFVLELDPYHEHFNSPRSPKDELYHLRQVHYRDTRTRTNLVDLDGIEMFLVKSVDWKYEHEWRIMRPLESSDKVINISGEKIHLFKLPADSIKSVILGARASEELINQVRRTITETKDMSHIKLYRCAPDESYFKINIYPDVS